MIITAREHLVPAGIGAPLFALYAVVIYEWLSRPGFYVSTPLETVVLSSLVLRAVAFLGVKRLRDGSGSVFTVLFGSDIFVFFGAWAAFAATTDPGYLRFGMDFTAAWLGSSVLVAPLPTIYLAVRESRGAPKLSQVLPSTALFFVFLSVVAATLPLGQGEGGIAGMTVAIVQGLKGTEGPLFGGVFLPLLGTLLFTSLVAMASLVGSESGSWEWVRGVAVGLSGILAALGWLLLVALVGGPYLFPSIPAVAIVALVWWSTRGS